MILEFKIKNYKSFREEAVFTMSSESSKLKPQNIHSVTNEIQQLFRASKVSVIYGPNASGKSNLLKSLVGFVNFLINKPSVGEAIAIFQPFVFNMETFRKPTVYELSFVGPEHIKYLYKVSVSKDVILEETLDYYPKKKKNNLFTRQSSQKSNSESEIHIVDKKQYSIFRNQLLLSKFGEEPHDILSNVYLYFKNKFNLEITESHINTQKKKENLKFILENPRYLQNISRLISAADIKVADIKIEVIEKDEKSDFSGIIAKKYFENIIVKRRQESDYKVQFSHKFFDKNLKELGKIEVPLSFQSKGTQTLLQIGVYILKAIENGQILIVDELDTSLHPYVTKMLVMLFLSDKINKNGAQLIFNTHDVSLLDEKLFRKDQIWFTEKNDLGESSLYSLRDFEGLREDIPFEKWYMAGKFGGLPSIDIIENIICDDAAN